MKHQFSPTGFPTIISDMVAKAAMELPPLTKPEDGEFLQAYALEVMQAFWNNYLILLPQQAQDEFFAVMSEDQKDSEEALAWFKTHANFKEDAAAEERGAKVLEEIFLKLPELMRQDYEDFQLEANKK